ncbi:MAG: hypothetical protein AB2A00_25050 [Myxococcota bacterium]
MPPVTNRPAGTVTTPSSTTSQQPTLPKIPAGASAGELRTLLDNNWQSLVGGRTKSLNVQEGEWLKKLAGHPNADAALKSHLGELAADVKLTKAAKTAGLADFLAGLRATTPASGGTTPLPPSSGGSNVPVSGGTVGSGGTVMDHRLGNTGAVVNPAHYKGTPTFDGPWKVKADALADAYKGIKADKFGTTDVQLPTGGSYNVRDFHYDLGGGKIGMRPVPVNDHGTITAPDGTTVPGHQVMDDLLRKEMGLGPDDPIYALIAYIHPEMHNGSLKDLATNMLKTEGGNTHLGAYVGAGRTTNSPETYHSNQWHVKGYPANVQIVSLQGVPQAVLNQNALIADKLLNKGVEFPPDYKNDLYKTIDLKTTLEFYQKWVRDDPELHSDPKWHTYCAEHKTIVTNIMLNVPHNEAAFKEIWGEAEGKKFFAEVKAKYESLAGEPMKETSFEPLWKKEGLTNPATETRIGKGLAWPPETTPDILNDFLNIYASFKDVGGVTVNALVLGFLDTVKQRTGVTNEQYIGLAMPVLNKVMIAEAKAQRFTNPAELQKFAQQKTAELYVGVGGKKEDFLPGGTLDAQKMELAKMMMKGVEAAAADVLQNNGLTREQATQWLNKAIEPDLERARSTPLGDPNKPQYFSPPNITHRIAQGIHESSPFVSIRTVATAMDSSEIEPK